MFVSYSISLISYQMSASVSELILLPNINQTFKNHDPEICLTLTIM